MGMAGAVLTGSLLGLGMSSMGKKKTPSYEYATDVHASMEQEKPAAPETPSPTTTNPDDGSGRTNAQMEAEREKERQQAALRRQQAREVFTSGLGASGAAETAKKTLLGG